jgi:Uma2 family endonuclease
MSKEAEVPAGPLEFPPALVVEVRSPSDSVRQMTDKTNEYLDAGVTVVIVLDPLTDSAAACRPGEWPQRYHNGHELKIPDFLPEFAVPIKKIFG